MKSGFKALRNSITRAFTTAFLVCSFITNCFATLTLDPTFAGGGKLTISFPDSSTGYSSRGLRIFAQQSGRIVAGGSFSWATPDGQLSGAAFVGLTPSGTLDSTFGSAGTVTDWRADASTSFSDALMYPDGSTLRLSQVFRLPVGSSTVSTVRLTTNGALDTVFASNVTIGPCCFGFFNARPVQISVRSDAKILALITDQGEYFLYRLNANGTRDTTFGSNGIIPIVFNKFSPTIFVEMIALSDGKILLVGHIAPFDSSGASEFFVARLTESGNWDKTFGRTGSIRMAFGAGMTGRIQNANPQADGKILLSGSVKDLDSDVWMMRLRSNGRVDTSFGANGVVIRDFAPDGTDIGTATALSDDGKIRLAGYSGLPANFLVARFAANGTFEEHTSIEFTPGQYAQANDLRVQADGKLLVIGETRNPNMAATTGSAFAIARLTE